MPRSRHKLINFLVSQTVRTFWNSFINFHNLACETNGLIDILNIKDVFNDHLYDWDTSVVNTLMWAFYTSAIIIFYQQILKEKNQPNKMLISIVSLLFGWRVFISAFRSLAPSILMRFLAGTARTCKIQKSKKFLLKKIIKNTKCCFHYLNVDYFNIWFWAREVFVELNESH